MYTRLTRIINNKWQRGTTPEDPAEFARGFSWLIGGNILCEEHGFTRNGEYYEVQYVRPLRKRKGVEIVLVYYWKHLDCWTVRTQ